MAQNMAIPGDRKNARSWRDSVPVKDTFRKNTMRKWPRMGEQEILHQECSSVVSISHLFPSPPHPTSSDLWHWLKARGRGRRSDSIQKYSSPDRHPHTAARPRTTKEDNSRSTQLRRASLWTGRCSFQPFVLVSCSDLPVNLIYTKLLLGWTLQCVTR